MMTNGAMTNGMRRTKRERKRRAKAKDVGRRSSHYLVTNLNFTSLPIFLLFYRKVKVKLCVIITFIAQFDFHCVIIYIPHVTTQHTI